MDAGISVDACLDHHSKGSPSWARSQSSDLLQALPAAPRPMAGWGPTAAMATRRGRNMDRCIVHTRCQTVELRRQILDAIGGGRRRLMGVTAPCVRRNTPRPKHAHLTSENQLTRRLAHALLSSGDS